MKPPRPAQIRCQHSAGTGRKCLRLLLTLHGAPPTAAGKASRALEPAADVEWSISETAQGGWSSLHLRCPKCDGQVAYTPDDLAAIRIRTIRGAP